MENIDFIGWVIQFGILINQDVLSLYISWKNRLKRTVLKVTPLISLSYKINKLGGWNNLLFNLCGIAYLHKL